MNRGRFSCSEMLMPGFLTGLVLALTLLLAACGGDDLDDLDDLSDDAFRTEFVDALTDGDALDRATAECVTDSIFAAFDRDTLTVIAEGGIESVSDEQFSVIAEAFTSCGAAE